MTVSWTVNIAGGTPFYTANIYRNGVFQRTGTSYSEQFCFDQVFRQGGAVQSYQRFAPARGQAVEQDPGNPEIGIGDGPGNGRTR